MAPIDKAKEAEDAWRRLVLSEINKVSEKTDETREGVKNLERQLNHIDERVSTLFRTQITDKSELSRAIESNRSGINVTGEVARDAKKLIEAHIKETTDDSRFRKAQAVAIAGFTFAVASGIFGAVMMVIQFKEGG